MLSIVVPMAGRGSRFAAAGRTPKPFIEVEAGRPMISYVVEHLRFAEPHRFVFVALADDARDHGLAGLLAPLAPGHELVLVDAVTGGPAATALRATPRIAGDDELIVAYCDCFFTIDLDASLSRWRRRDADGGVLIYPSHGPTEAYARLSTGGVVEHIAEKEVISTDAVAGLYYFRSVRDFVTGARQTLAAAPGTEVFVSSVYNALIARGAVVLGERIDRAQRIEMGTPADLALARHWLADSRMRPAA